MKTTKKTATIQLFDIKDPDGWQQLADELELTEKQRAHFEFAEYASIELVIDQDLKIVGGRIL